MSFTLVQGDTAPTVIATLTRSDTGAVLNLTGCTVRFQMRKADGTRYVVDAPATVAAPTTGIATYQFAAGDLEWVGDFIMQWEVTYPDLRVQTTATPVTVTVRRE